MSEGVIWDGTASVVRHYDMIVEAGNDPFRDPPELIEYMGRWDGEKFIGAMELKGTESVLEIGVGTGRLAARIAPLCGKFTGIDISPKSLERAKENLAGLGNIELLIGDFLTHEFHERFDVVCSSLTLMHFREKQSFMTKAASLLNDNGIFCLSIDKNRSEFIDMGKYRLKVYPDIPEQTAKFILTAGMRTVRRLETDFADIFVCLKSNKV